jgi:hypothetical protein
MATTYRVSFDIVIENGHPRKWIPDAVYQGLEDGEDVFNWEFREIDEPVDVPTE